MLPRTGPAAATGYGVRVSFAQQGPPASAKQVAYIQALMRKAGYDDFRSARTEYRLTPRQARGKFTKSEASALIDRLTSTDDDNPTLSVSEEPETLDLGAGVAGPTGSRPKCWPTSCAGAVGT